MGKTNLLHDALVINPVDTFLCTRKKKLAKTLKKVGILEIPDFTLNGSDAATHFFERNDGRNVAVVCITPKKKYTKEQHLSLLVHEATHVWQAIKDLIGEQYPSSEFEAYAIQGISEQLMSMFDKQTRKRNGK